MCQISPEGSNWLLSTSVGLQARITLCSVPLCVYVRPVTYYTQTNLCVAYRPFGPLLPKAGCRSCASESSISCSTCGRTAYS